MDNLIKAKEPWEMTRAEFNRFYEQEYKKTYGKELSGMDILTPFKNHEFEVQEAVASGKPVPPEVLKDYPDLVTLTERTERTCKMKTILRTAILLASLSLMIVCLQVSCPAIYGPAWDSIKESSERNEFGGGTSGGAGAGGGY